MKKNSHLLFLLLLSFLLNTGSTLPVVPTRDDNLGLGNPSNAQNNILSPDNYLIVKNQYALSYNNSTHTANWVSWHLSMAWKGDAKRSSSFYREKNLPEGWYKVSEDDYTNSGFDRGHLCPSDDRDATTADNKETFKMINIIPQTPDMNQGSWKNLEDYCRDLLKDNELYIIAGAHGKGGVGNEGFREEIGEAKITVPQRVWKVILVLPVGTDDLHRINADTRVIAVWMPNNFDGGMLPWYKYITTVDKIEEHTKYDLFSILPEDLQKILEQKRDTEVLSRAGR